MERLGFLERLVIVARHGILKVLVDIRVLGQDGHQGETIVAGRAEGPEPLHIRNCHNFYQCSKTRFVAAWEGAWRYTVISDMKLQSHTITQGRDRAPARAMLKAIGFTDEDLAKPIIGVANTWIETMPCN